MNGDVNDGGVNADALAVGLARQAVAEIAPDELTLFEETSAAFLASRGAAAYRRRARREPLAMGIEIVGEVVTGVALAVAVEVVRHATFQAAEAVGTRARPRLARWFRRRGARADGPTGTDPGAGADAGAGPEAGRRAAAGPGAGADAVAGPEAGRQAGAGATPRAVREPAPVDGTPADVPVGPGAAASRPEAAPGDVTAGPEGERATDDAPGPPPLTPDHLARLREIAVTRATALGLADDRAGLLADAIVGGLVAAQTATPPPRTRTVPSGDPAAG
ncbi:hypothetical protein ACIRD2_05245 [Streptomyces sp. NPDC093595]|uniref:hypothetical protein n=1 Tax=Streptomyces sp. NPDC093595 TaxID=3366045 RepID=UPI003825D331